MENVVINEVSLRDGLQLHREFVPTAEKLRLLKRLVDAGIRDFEVTSFVSPKAVPQMADASDVFAGLPVLDGVSYSALVPNRKGLERAADVGCKTVNLVLSATDTMNEKNIRMSLDEAKATCVDTIEHAATLGVNADAYIAVAFECPFERRVDPRRIVDLTREMFEAGAGRVIIADTIGAAAPAQVSDLFSMLVPEFGAERFACHFHDTRAMALANVWEALQQGIRRFDSAVGGLGGCPFAPGASGNLATEDLLLFLRQCGFETGVSLGGVVSAIDVAAEITGRALGGRVMPWVRTQLDQANTEEVPA
nr:hydroxymethylglutaryl-CoA lyase [Methylonatrum kenyense]